MSYSIRELRYETKLTQKKFAELYGIPLRTLQKWEQGEASPAPYVVELIAKTLPAANHITGKEIRCQDGRCFYYDIMKKCVSDDLGNTIYIREDLKGVKEKNLQIYLEDLYDGFYEIRSRFERDCRFDKEEDIIWTR